MQNLAKLGAALAAGALLPSFLAADEAACETFGHCHLPPWVPSDAVAFEEYGQSVDIDGTTAAVSSMKGGPVAIFERSGATWVQVQSLPDPAGLHTDEYGRELSLDGDFLAVGSPRDATLGNLAGAVHMFRRTNGVWELFDTVYDPSPGDQRRFGFHVALSGPWLGASVYGNSPSAEARLGPDPKSLPLGHALNLWGLALADVGRHEEAIEKLLESLEILRWNHGGGHPSIGQVRTNLGESYYQLARHDEAEQQHRLALEVHRLLGDEARVARSQSYLARAAYGRGELGLAEERFREALAIRERVLHADDPARRLSLLELGVVLEDAGRAEDALGLFEAALAVPRSMEHPPLTPVAEGMARFRLGRQLHQLGAYEAAREELGRALEVQEEALGPDHPQTRATRLLLGVER